MPTSVRLDAKTESLVNRLAKRTGRTKSEVIREAITRLAEADQVARPATTPYEAIRHLIGIGKGGPPDLSERTGDKVRQLLQERYRARQRGAGQAGGMGRRRRRR